MKANELNTNSQQIKIFIISTIGCGLEFYDFMIFMLFSPIIAKVFFPKTLHFMPIIATYFIFAIGFLLRPIGGIIIGHFGDKIGRKTIFSVTIFLMASSSLFIGLLPSYKEIGIMAPILLLLLRAVQGIAVGGEMSGAITFTFEHMNEKFKSFGVILLFLGPNLAVLFGTFSVFLITHIFNNTQVMSFGWRICFILGSILGYVGVWLRKKTKETPIFKNLKKNNMKSNMPIIDMLKNYKVVISSVFLFAPLASCIFVFTLFVPSYLNNFCHYPLKSVFIINLINLISIVIFIVLSAFISKKIKNKKMYMFASIALLILVLPFFALFQLKNIFLTSFLYIILLLCTSFLYTGAVLIAENFNDNIRFSGVSTSINIGMTVFGGFSPFICAILIKVFRTPLAPAYFLLFTILLGFITILRIKK